MQIFSVQNDCDKLRMIMMTLSINNINTWQMRFADNYKRGELNLCLSLRFPQKVRLTYFGIEIVKCWLNMVTLNTKFNKNSIHSILNIRKIRII